MANIIQFDREPTTDEMIENLKNAQKTYESAKAHYETMKRLADEAKNEADLRQEDALKLADDAMQSMFKVQDEGQKLALRTAITSVLRRHRKE